MLPLDRSATNDEADKLSPATKVGVFLRRRLLRFASVMLLPLPVMLRSAAEEDDEGMYTVDDSRLWPLR